MKRELNKPAILFLPYLPPISWFGQLIGHQPVWIEHEENFPKSTYRNRCEIATANGRITLSIPLVGGRDHHQLYKDVQISYHTDWQRIHWNSIRSAYGNTPFFEHYAERFQNFYEKQHQFLFDFNLELLNAVLAILHIEFSDIKFTAVYDLPLTDMTDLRNAELVAKTAFTGQHYHQVFEDRHGFLSNLSIIDLIFNIGPGALEWINRMED